MHKNSLIDFLFSNRYHTIDHSAVAALWAMLSLAIYHWNHLSC